MYISHYGILGQKWGKRNGPPYPLRTESNNNYTDILNDKVIKGKKIDIKRTELNGASKLLGKVIPSLKKKQSQ